MIRSQFIKTPGIENCRNYVIIQKLAEARIHSILLEEPFTPNVEMLVEQYMEVPPALYTQEAIQKYIKSEAKEILGAFKRFEENPSYIECIGYLKPYAGKCFNITNITLSGITVLIEVSGEE